MPTDKKIWAEADALISTYSKAIAKERGLPDSKKLFREKKAWY
jgi:hypothetical protein